MDEQQIADAPDPLDTVTLLKSDFELLQRAVQAAEQDFKALCEVLRITPPEGQSPHQVMNEMLLPIIAGVLAQSARQHELSSQAERMVNEARARGGREIDLGDGRKAVLAGKRRPELLQGVSARDLLRRRGR